jgi:hypothetical protein
LSPNKVQFQLTLSQRLPPKNVAAINLFIGQTRAPPQVVVEGNVGLPVVSVGGGGGAQKRLLSDLDVDSDTSSAAPSGRGGGKFAKKLRGMQLPPSGRK